MSFTIVTAADENFVWGAYLFIASLRKNNITAPVHLLCFGRAMESKALLEQFPDVTLFEADTSDPRNIACQKAQAIYTAEKETGCIAWIDSDCICTGDINDILPVEPGQLQIRIRPSNEIAYLFRLRYAADEARGEVPRSVLDIWRKDVAGLQEPAMKASCNAHAFVIHSSNLDFIKRWEAQIKKVIPPENKGIVNDSSYAYFLLDEAVMSSLLAFDPEAPTAIQTRLEGTKKKELIHLGGTPKPWQLWSIHSLPYFDEILDIIEWTQSAGYTLPEGHRGLFHRNRLPLYKLGALLYNVKHVGRRYLRDFAKKLLRRNKTS